MAFQLLDRSACSSRRRPKPAHENYSGVAVIGHLLLLSRRSGVISVATRRVARSRVIEADASITAKLSASDAFAHWIQSTTYVADALRRAAYRRSGCASKRLRKRPSVTSRSIDQPFVLRALKRGIGAPLIAENQPLAMVVVHKVGLGIVSVQMCFRNMERAAKNSALEHRKIVSNRRANARVRPGASACRQPSRPIRYI